MSEATEILSACVADDACLRLPIPEPFDIDVSLPGSWVTLECELAGSADPFTVERLHAVACGWRDWVNQAEAAASRPDDAAQVSDPLAGADFVQWQLQLHLTQPERLNILVNAMMRLYERGVNIRLLYIG